MRIAYLVDYYPPNHDGGDSVFARDLGLELKNNVDLTVFTRLPEREHTQEYDDSGMTIIHLGQDWKDQLSKKSQDIQVIHFFQVQNLPVIHTLQAMTGAPALFHMELSYRRYAEHNAPDYDADNYNALEQDAVNLSRIVVSPCEQEARELNRIYPAADIRVIPNAINYHARLQAPFPEPKALEPRIFCFMGRIDDTMKGGDELLHALKELPALERNASEFLFIGCRDTRFTQMLGNLQSPINYKALPWIANQQELWSHLAKAHFMLMPSRYETFGMACLEGMAMGIVPIVSSAGALPELTAHENGLRLPELNSHYLGEAIKTASNLPLNTFLTMRKNGINTARSVYTTEAITHQVLNLYTELTEGTR